MSDEQKQPVPVTPIRDDNELLTRIDERTLHMENAIKEIQNDLDSKYVTQSEFWPVKTIVYAGAGIILTSVFGGLIALVLRG